MIPSRLLAFDYGYLMLLGAGAIYVGVRFWRRSTGKQTTLSPSVTVALILSGIFGLLAGTVALAKLLMM